MESYRQIATDMTHQVAGIKGEVDGMIKDLMQDHGKEQVTLSTPRVGHESAHTLFLNTDKDGNEYVEVEVTRFYKRNEVDGPYVVEGDEMDVELYIEVLNKLVDTLEG